MQGAFKGIEPSETEARRRCARLGLQVLPARIVSAAGTGREQPGVPDVEITRAWALVAPQGPSRRSMSPRQGSRKNRPGPSLRVVAVKIIAAADPRDARPTQSASDIGLDLATVQAALASTEIGGSSEFSLPPAQPMRLMASVRIMALARKEWGIGASCTRTVMATLVVTRQLPAKAAA